MNDVAQSKDLTFSIENKPDILTQEDYYNLVRSLNSKQREVFNYIEDWCVKQTIANISTKPLHLFISGGAGTGKSHLISAIFQMASRRLQNIAISPESIQIAITAPTGSSAFNVCGSTIHSAFHLNLTQKNNEPYKRLSDETRNSLRMKLANLKILICDEISMVGTSIFQQVNNRLCEITGSNEPFGGVSVLTFGDLYQLEPVLQSFIFQSSNNLYDCFVEPPWRKFKLVELQQIMRQNDDLCFAQLLNRIRTADHTLDDLNTLELRNDLNLDNVENELHIYALNQDVNKHNQKMLEKLKLPISTLKAIDKFPQGKSISKNPIFSAGLPEEIKVAVSARVMLIRNVDTSDGLVNGAHGIIKSFAYDSNHQIKAVLIEFDNDRIGIKIRSKNLYLREQTLNPKSTPIERTIVPFLIKHSNAKVTASRSQFPIMLSFACTIHKVQGLTVPNIVMDFKGRFRNGQAYVGLSRVKSKDGLYLKNFNPTKIHSNPVVKEEMKYLKENKKLIISDIFTETENPNSLKFCLLNIRSIIKHQADLINDPVFQQADIVFITETWCNQFTQLNFHSYDRSTLQLDKPSAPANHSRTAGGIAILSKKNVSLHICQQFTSETLQILMVRAETISTNIYYVLCYCSPKSSPKFCIEKIKSCMSLIDNNEYLVVLGDFNQNALKFSLIQDTLVNQGLTQHIQQATHQEGACLDHIYTRGFKNFTTQVNSVYYSDHLWIKAVAKIL